jgi:hypothetical protein
MKKRRALCVIVFLTTAAVVAITPWFFLSRGPTCTWETFEMLKPGMTEAEVTAILGAPPGDYSDGPRQYVAFISACDADFIKDSYKKYWIGRDGAIGVKWQDDGKLRYADYYPALDPPSSLWERISRRFSFAK